MHNNVVFVFDIDTTLANTDERAKVLKEVCNTCLTETYRTSQAFHDSEGDVFCPTCRKYNPDTKVPQSAWDAFCDPDKFVLDTPMPEAVKFVKQLREKCNHIYFLTGRNEDARSATEAWLFNHYGREHYGEEKLVMRPLSMRSVAASIYKEQAFLNEIQSQEADGSTFFFFEDDEYVFSMYSKYGIVVKCPEAWETFNPPGNESGEPTWRR